MIRDRLVVGIRDKSLAERLQMDSALTLEKAKIAIRQREAIQDNKSLWRGDDSSDPIRVDAVKGKTKSDKHFKKVVTATTPKQCTRCGKGSHQRDKCPARNAVCHKCHKKGHYSAYCLSKSVANVTMINQQTHSDTAFLDTIGSDHTTSWTVKLKLLKLETMFKLDTGAEATAISEYTHSALGKPSLSNPSKILYGPGEQQLNVLGQFEGTLQCKQRSCKHIIFVVKGLKTNLLGLPAIIELNLAARLDSTTDYDSLVQKKFQSIFKGLGNLGEPYTIQLKEYATPHAIFSARNIPLPLRSKVQDELTRMESEGIISKVHEPTLWCAGMVAVPKKSGSVRICVDLKRLNQSVMREVYPLPKVDETLAQLYGATIFTRLDANSGFWQIPLSPESRLLTTFITPFGRYCFNKLPFGISSAPEHFQRRMSRILSGLAGVVCQMDDVLIFGCNRAEHDARLEAALTRIKAAGITLNRDKCVFGQEKLQFLGHVVDRNGISADPSKVTAIAKMRSPENISELRRFLGMVNQLGKFTPNLATITQPLRELLSKKNSWCWTATQEQAFSATKNELLKPTVLALYNPNAPTKVSADASSFGLGAVLLQKNSDAWKPIAFASRSLSEVERRYAQIEKEALATTWACEKFVDYILGTKFTIETDHKPLVPLLSTTHLHSLPPRVLRFRLRLNRFDYDISHVPGKKLCTADTLSRAPIAEPGPNSVAFQNELELFMEAVTSSLPTSHNRLQEYCDEQKTDPVCSRIRNYCTSGWPDISQIPLDLKPYAEIRSELSLCNDILLRGWRIVVPTSLQKLTLQKIHHGHQGIQKCRSRANSSVWWPLMSQQITKMIKSCQECTKNSTVNREPMIPSTLPDYPWQIIGTDLFQHKGTTYLLVVDYFSRFPEIVKLTNTTSNGVIAALRPIFARYGIPEIVRSDNGPQYVSQEMTNFATSYGFVQITSSPHYPRSNGLAERTVKTVKAMLEKSTDPHLALLSYRSTELSWCNLSPAQLLMGRRIRSTVPEISKNFLPEWTYLKRFREQERQYKEQQVKYHDKRHRARPLADIPDNQPVWVNTDSQQQPGRIVTTAEAPRSYLVDTSSGRVRRNRQQLVPMPENNSNVQSPENSTKMSTSMTRSTPVKTRSQTGTRIVPPDRLTY